MSDRGITTENLQNEMPARYSEDLRKVGPNKPLGYLPLDTLRDNNHEDPVRVMEEARQKGLYAEIYAIGETKVASGALVVADLEALEKLLLKNIAVLTESRWPQDPVSFIHRAMVESAPSHTKLFDLIADAYADQKNSGRSDRGHRMRT